MNPVETIQMRPIGRIYSRFTDPAGMPIQTAGAPEEPGRIEVLPEYEAGLKDIADFDYLILITHLHRGSKELLEVTPFLDDQPHGVFATRAPARPNRLGLSIVRLLSVERRTLHFSGNDMLDGTPVLDIKPYVPRFDSRSTERIGWFAKRIGGLAEVKSDDRMS